MGDIHMNHPLRSHTPRVSWVDDLLDAKSIGRADRVHQSSILVFERRVELLLLPLGLGLLQLPSVADFDAAVNRAQTLEPCTVGHHRVAVVGYTDAVQTTSRSVEDRLFAVVKATRRLRHKAER